LRGIVPQSEAQRSGPKAGAGSQRRSFGIDNEELALARNSDRTTASEQALFKKEQRQREGEKAMAEYQAGLTAMREKTAKLKALRLARDAATAAAPAPAAPKAQARPSAKAKRPG
jgi:hypothetical protein